MTNDIKEELKKELLEDAKKRKQAMRLFENWTDNVNVDQLDKIENVLHSLLGNFPANTIELVQEHDKEKV